MGGARAINGNPRPYMRKPTKKTLTNKLDRECSRVVRARGFCARCNMIDYEKFQCAHIYSRSYRSVRWDLDNLLCLCSGCHLETHRKPLEFADFVKTYLGDVLYISLKLRATSIKKWTIYEMEELLEFLKALA